MQEKKERTPYISGRTWNAARSCHPASDNQQTPLGVDVSASGRREHAAKRRALQRFSSLYLKLQGATSFATTNRRHEEEVHVKSYCDAHIQACICVHVWTSLLCVWRNTCVFVCIYIYVHMNMYGYLSVLCLYLSACVCVCARARVRVLVCSRSPAQLHRQPSNFRIRFRS